MSKLISYKVGRKAGPGTFCTVAYARAHPRTTVVETIKRPVTRTTMK